LVGAPFSAGNKGIKILNVKVNKLVCRGPENDDPIHTAKRFAKTLQCKGRLSILTL